MYIELHAIQTFGPSNLNRDDTGNPKDSLFGGVRRARVSSQCAKRAIRKSHVFAQEIQVPPGTRTKTLVDQVARRLMAAGMDEEEANAGAEQVVGAVFASADKKSAKKTNVLVFISEDEINLLTEYVLQAREQGSFPGNMAKDLTKRLKDRSLAPDIALFGRMLAENPDLNVDAACQVAHALSTHEVNTAEFDYFTAVDDLSPGDETGAGMLGLVAYNSATYYRCVRIHWEQLLNNLHGDVDLALNTLSGFMKAFALVVPSGMQNSFVNQHAPDFLLAVVRYDNNGQSLDVAFEKPVRARGGSGFAEESVKALATYWDQVESVFRLNGVVVSALNPRQFELPSEELRQAVQPRLLDWVSVITDAVSRETA